MNDKKNVVKDHCHRVRALKLLFLRESYFAMFKDGILIGYSSFIGDDLREKLR